MADQAQDNLVHGVRPGSQAPNLEVALLGGGTWRLSEIKPENYQMLVFYRGHFCPHCKKQLSELASLRGEFDQRGVEILAVSADDEQHAAAAHAEWNLAGLTLGYGLGVDAIKAWGLFVSKGDPAKGQAAVFNEPGLFLLKPDRSVFYIALNSAPFARPPLPVIISQIDNIRERMPDYPYRGGHFPRA